MCETLDSILSPAKMHKKEYATISITIPKLLEFLVPDLLDNLYLFM